MASTRGPAFFDAPVGVGYYCPIMMIRLAQIGECEMLSELAYRSKGHWPYNREVLQSYRNSLAVEPADILSGSVFVGCEGAEVVGFYGLSPTNLTQLYFMFVDPPFIGRGFGYKLWLHAIVEARRRGWKSLVLFTDAYAAEKFYIPLGCRVVEESTADTIPLLKLVFDL